MIDQKFIQMLRCPVSGEPLEIADQSVVDRVNDAIERGVAFDRIDQQVEQQIDGGLCCGTWLYPIRDSIPTLVADEAIAIGALTDVG